MKLLITLLLVTAAFSQTLTLTGPVNASPGQSVSLSFNLAGASTKSISGVQWSTVPSSGTLGTSTTSVPGKGIFCSATSQTCMVVGVVGTTLNNSAISDGVVGQLQLQIPATAVGSISVPLSSLAAVDSTGTNVAITSGTLYSLSVLSKCDVNKDGKTDAADAMSIINGALGLSTCLISSCTLQAAIQVIIAAAGQACTLP